MGSAVADSNQVIITEHPEKHNKETLKEKIKKSCDVELNDKIRSDMNARAKHVVRKIENIKVGSEISYGRWGYKHHAVVVDVDTDTDQYKIIHLSGDSSDSFKASSSSGDGKAKPISEWKSMKDTPEDKSFYYDYKKPFESDVIIGRAEALMKLFPGSAKLNFNLLKFNCQHFASYCVTGVPYCKKYNKMLCCCKRGTAINSEFKKTLDDLLKGNKTPPGPSATQHTNDKPRPLPHFPQQVKSTIQTSGDSNPERKKRKKKKGKGNKAI